MLAVALVYFGLALLTLAVAGAVSEKLLLPDDDFEKQIEADTCRKHGRFLCEECFPVGVACEHPPHKRWFDYSRGGEEFCECGTIFGGVYDQERH